MYHSVLSPVAFLLNSAVALIWTFLVNKAFDPSVVRPVPSLLSNESSFIYHLYEFPLHLHRLDFGYGLVVTATRPPPTLPYPLSYPLSPSFSRSLLLIWELSVSISSGTTSPRRGDHGSMPC